MTISSPFISFISVYNYNSMCEVCYFYCLHNIQEKHSENGAVDDAFRYGSVVDTALGVCKNNVH